MNYKEYTDSKAGVSEYMFTVSDGACLRIIDFIPALQTGKKPVIVFIAGWISLISGWKDFLRAVTPFYRVIYVETREKSSSIIDNIKKVSFNMERLRNDIGDIIDALVPAGTGFVLSGSSLGASAIMEYCVSGRRSPVCTVLVGPNPEFRFPRVLGSIIPVLHPSLYFAIKPVIKWYLRNFRVNSAAEKEQIEKYEMTLDYADPYKLKRNALEIKTWTFNKESIISIPSLVLGATTDSLHSPENLKRIMSHFTNGEYIELASNRETHSEKAARVMMDYINRQAK